MCRGGNEAKEERGGKGCSLSVRFEVGEVIGDAITAGRNDVVIGRRRACSGSASDQGGGYGHQQPLGAGLSAGHGGGVGARRAGDS